MERATGYWFIMCLLVTASAAGCGGTAGSESPSQFPSDASDTDASVGDDGESDSSVAQDTTADEFDPNAYEGYHVVDGGTDCGAGSVPVGHSETRTCCNGAPCEGLCVVEDSSPTPFCYCAALVGGCPVEASVCCVFEHRCTPPEGCSAGLP